MAQGKFHVGANGPSPCHAKKKCPLQDTFGEPAAHFDSEREAEAYYQGQMTAVHGMVTTLTKGGTDAPEPAPVPTPPSLSELSPEQRALTEEILARGSLLPEREEFLYEEVVPSAQDKKILKDPESDPYPPLGLSEEKALEDGEKFKRQIKEGVTDFGGHDLREMKLQGDGSNSAALPEEYRGHEMAEIFGPADKLVVVHDADLTKAHLEGASFTSVALTDTTLDDTHWERGKLHEVFMGGIGGSRLHLEDSDITSVVINSSDLPQLNAQRADIGASEATDSDLSGARFTEAKLTQCEFYDSNFSGVDHRGGTLQEVWYSHCSLEKTNFSEAKLTDCSFGDGTDLRNSSWQGAELSLPNFSTVDLRGADFSGAKLAYGSGGPKEGFRNCKMDATTKPPLGHKRVGNRFELV